MKRYLAPLALVAATLLPATLASADPASGRSGVDADVVVDETGDAPSSEWLYWGCYNGVRFNIDLGPGGWYGSVQPGNQCGGLNFIRPWN